ncbi:MAG: hypothetical protein IKF78_15910 [Atopobiaceae bacterium]|nr:hypothetical protein [Atopobiaceae bacterium]
MYADDKDVYLPFQTVSSVYSDFGFHSKKTESGFPDYSGFYDLDLLFQVMNEHYGTQVLPNAA